MLRIGTQWWSEGSSCIGAPLFYAVIPGAMRIALLGGTGDVGEGLALRWAFDTTHEVIIGSRDPDRARNKAAEYETELASRGVDKTVNGYVNEMAADRADIVVASVPAEYVVSTVTTVADQLTDSILVSPAVGMERDETGFHYAPPAAGSFTEAVAEVVPASVPVVGAFHNLAADRLANLDAPLDLDVPIVGTDDDAVETITLLTQSIEGLRPLDAGEIVNAREIEAITPLLINLAMKNDGLHDLGVKFQ